MTDLFDELTEDGVREWCAQQDTDEARAMLVAEFDRGRDYRDAAGWNRLVRVCEALAVLGWGERTPVEAIAERWINGSMYTQLRDQRFTMLPDGERGWSRKGDGFVLTDGDRSHAGPVLGTQRIMLAKNPLRISQSGNYQRDAEPFVAELAALRDLLDERLVRNYGPGFSHVGWQLNFSYADAGPGLASEYFHDEADVVAHPVARAWVRPRLEVGRLSTRRGELTVTITRHYTTAEGRADLADQKRSFAEDTSAVLDALATKLAKKAPGYRCTQLRTDVVEVLETWLAR